MKLFLPLLMLVSLLLPVSAAQAIDFNPKTRTEREFFFDGDQSSSTEPNVNPFAKDLVTGGKDSLGPEITGIAQMSPVLIVANIVRIALSFIGIGTIILLVYAGFLWMTSGGEDSQISKAKSLIKNGIIGLIIITMAYSITSYVIRRLYSVTAREGYIYLQI